MLSNTMAHTASWVRFLSLLVVVSLWTTTHSQPSNTFSSLSSQDSEGRELLFFNNDPIMKTVFGVERNIEDINFPSSEEIDGLESVLPDGIVHGWFDSTFENKQLHRRKWEASDPQAIVIFMHGISTHSAKYVQSSSSSNETSPPRLISATLMVDTFLQNNISVYAYDQYGHGYSEGVRFLIPESYTVNVEDYINFCQLVATENTLGKPIFLMCESYGCTVQLHAAKYFQDQAATENQLPDLDSMILTAPAITMAPASQPIAQTVAFSVLIFLSIFFPEWRPFFVPNFATPESVWRDPLVRAFYTNSTNPATIVDGSGLQYRLGTARQLLRAITNVGETIIPMLATPFITIHGTGDAVTPISGSEFLFENSLTPSDSKEIIKVDGAYHDLLADPAAEICMDGIMQWINQRVALLPVSSLTMVGAVRSSSHRHDRHGTGLLSLNVHEALNFDGTPICLHPDLFTASVDGVVGGVSGGGGGGGGSTGTASTHVSMGTTVVAGNPPPPPPLPPHRLMLNPTMSSDDGVGSTGTVVTSNTFPTILTDKTTTTINTTTNTTTTNIIQVGDLIEIRVWDPCGPTAIVTSQPTPVPHYHQHQSRPHATNNSSNNNDNMNTNANTNNRSSILRRPTPPRSAQVAATAATSSNSHASSTNNNGQTSSTSPVNLPPPPPTPPILETTTTSNDDDADADHDDELSRPVTTSPLSLHTESLPQQKSPSDGTAPVLKLSSTANTTTLLLSQKPPIPRRAVTTSGVPETTGTTTTTTAKMKPSSAQQLVVGSSSTTGGRHTRDISDMTVETDHDNKHSSHFHDPSLASRITTSEHQSVVSAPVGVQRNHHLDDPSNSNNNVVWNQHLMTTPNNNHFRTHQLRVSFCMLVTEATLTSLKGSARTQISILRPVADLYQLSSYDMVSVHILNRDDDDDTDNDVHNRSNDNNNNMSINESAIARHNVGVDFLLVTIKDQFMSRGDMHYFQNSMIGHWVYQGQRLYESTRGFQANAREIRRSAEHVLSGIITSKTVITFRSRSSRIIWLVQMSSEMWDYAPIDHNHNNNNESVCEIYFDKWITFIHKLFTKWKELEATHALTVVFFSRTFLSSPNPIPTDPTADPSQPPPQLQRDVYGRYYEDHFRVVLENETTTDWHSLVIRIKEAFVRYPFEVRWSLQSNFEGSRKPSTASHGNVLEAINVTLNLLQFHYLDRDLQRTGNSIVVVSAGNGVFEVNRNLNGITYQRMMDNGIGSDMLSLGLPALHIAPFFLYSNPPTEALIDESQEQYYDVPHWMHLSFVSYESDEAVFVDHLYDPKENQRNEKDVNMHQAEIEVSSNGFVLSSSYRKTSEIFSSPLQQPFRKGPQGGSSGRQLIDGREFQDIVDACRPRHTGKIPSALFALLRISSGESKLHHDKLNPPRADNIEEWGSLRFVSLHQSAAGIRPPVTDFIGSLSSGQLSISPQRSFSDMNNHLNRTTASVCPRPAAQLQRSGSLTLEVDDNEANSNMETLLRNMMRTHDSTTMNMVSPKLGPKVEPLYAENPMAASQSTLQSGVGAALNQYRITSSRNFNPPSERGNTMLSRTTSLFEPSGATGQASLRRIADAESHRLSPLLLPPAASTTIAQQKTPEIIPFERRLISYGSPPKDNAMRFRSDGGLASPTSKIWQRGAANQTRTNTTTSRRKKMFNPFRQEDEDAVLAMKSHNRRRWSHVFPLGEVEFKRHAGPNWKSLTAPAILPLSIDYFPPQEEIDYHFTSGFHNVTLSEFEHKNFSSNKDLLVEMARQRLTQDFQVVPEDCIDMRKYRMVPLEGTLNASTEATAKTGGTETIRLFLSMGHILHTLTYYKSRDIVEVRRYTAKETQKNYTDNYQYLTICQETQSFKKCQQTFAKYTDQYNWNKVDNIICGDDDREMREGMRFKRIMFGIIPDHFGCDRNAEDAYVAKFRRLLEYLEKLRDKAEASTPLSIKFITSLEKENQNESQRLESLPGVERDSMVRFYVQLRKGKSDILEWMEVAVDATFDSSWTYRIMFNWLVASSGKVDSQVQLLQRRCTQYGLRLIPFPQVTVSKNVYLNPFKAPAILVAKQQSMDRMKLDRRLVEMDFVYDGVFLTAVEPILECIGEDGSIFQFRRDRFKATIASAIGKQFIHRSGTIFVRVLCDLNERFIFVVLGNYRYLNMMSNKDSTVIKTYTETYDALKSFASTL